jgi:hypothetical protein
LARTSGGIRNTVNFAFEIGKKTSRKGIGAVWLPIYFYAKNNRNPLKKRGISSFFTQKPVQTAVLPQLKAQSAAPENRSFFGHFLKILLPVLCYFTIQINILESLFY